MHKKVEKVYEIGINKVNEDDFILDQNNNIYAVIDGATGLGGLSGKIASSIIKEGLLLDENQGTLLEKAEFANRLLGKRTVELTNKESMSHLPKEQRSSCGIAAVKIKMEQSKMEYIHAGDCMLFIQYTDGSVRSLTKDHISPLDSIAITEFERLLKTNLSDLSDVSIEQAKEILDRERTGILDLLRENRAKLNTLGGYGILDGSEDATQFIEYGIISLNRVHQILLLSDGLQIPSCSWEETAGFAFDNGLEPLLKKINDLEMNDLLCLNYPRLKIADDKTGILLTF
ncbi:protein phosphatase 2C domain-containing protein [Mesobacillus sp. S13]|uniref:protein phosphatase 2C domain-containing protein n=1 Tax=Mesobacillus sp. S13 TaxID=2880221 RepID=UPI001CF0F024|nr:protein phosphatase 2C domain-containing protein [Mesobacillus sp. S13]